MQDYDLITQPTAAPTRKVAAGGIAGAVVVGLIAAVNYLWPEFGDQIAPAIEAAVVWVVAFVSAYMAKERA
jgi:hypothetical protein